jgi:glycosyltransferase involved in cell wall biosynthesis
MSTGCAIVASDTAPLKEVIVHNETGRMINFFNPNDLAINIAELLESKEERSRLGNNARNFAIKNYDIQRILCNVLNTTSK